MLKNCVKNIKGQREDLKESFIDFTKTGNNFENTVQNFQEVLQCLFHIHKEKKQTKILKTKIASFFKKNDNFGQNQLTSTDYNSDSQTFAISQQVSDSEISLIDLDNGIKLLFFKEIQINS